MGGGEPRGRMPRARQEDALNMKPKLAAAAAALRGRLRQHGLPAAVRIDRSFCVRSGFCRAVDQVTAGSWVGGILVCSALATHIRAASLLPPCASPWRSAQGALFRASLTPSRAPLLKCIEACLKGLSPLRTPPLLSMRTPAPNADMRWRVTGLRFPAPQSRRCSRRCAKSRSRARRL